MEPERTTDANHPDAPPAGTTATGGDLERLQGTWATASMVIDGRMIPEAAIRQRRVIMIDDRFAVVDENRTLRRGRFRIDPTATPRQIDTLPLDGPNAGLVNPGIYEFQGDLLRLCHAAPGKPRPTDFSSSPGSGQSLVTDRKEVPAITPRTSPVIVVVTDRNPDVPGLFATSVHHRDFPNVRGKGPTHREAAINLLQHLISESGTIADNWHRETAEQVIAEVRSFLDQHG